MIHIISLNKTQTRAQVTITNPETHQTETLHLVNKPGVGWTDRLGALYNLKDSTVDWLQWYRTRGVVLATQCRMAILNQKADLAFELAAQAFHYLVTFQGQKDSTV